MELGIRDFYLLLHIFGAIIGAGGAYVSDIIFLSSVKDKVISKTELRFMKIGSIFVWTGLVILIITGLLIFSTNTSLYLDSSKFLIKVFIVFVILLNGLVFHLVHLPRIDRHVDHHYPSSDEFSRKKKLLVASGVVSVTSWTLTVILGSLPSIPFSFLEALSYYIVFEIFVVTFSLFFTDRFV